MNVKIIKPKIIKRKKQFCSYASKVKLILKLMLEKAKYDKSNYVNDIENFVKRYWIKL